MNASDPSQPRPVYLDYNATTPVAAQVVECDCGDDAVSGVIAAMGMDAPRAIGAVRLSVGMMTTESDIDGASHALIAAWRSLAAG